MTVSSRIKKKIESPEIECDYYYSKIEGLEYTTTTIDRPDGNGRNYWYYHYELSHTTENIERACNYLGISQESVIIMEVNMPYHMIFNTENTFYHNID